MDPLPETDDDKLLDNADDAQLREQIRTLNKARREDQKTLKQVLEQVATLAAALAAQQNPVRSVERDDGSSTGSQERTQRYSKKLPDLDPLSNGTNPTFES